MGSKTAETKHFLKTFLCFLTSTFLLPKTYKEVISDQYRQPMVPCGPKEQGKGPGTLKYQILSALWGY
jgi:hypothetical protein